MKQHLENEGSYELNDIGTLSLNEDGNYEFVPCEAGMLTPELYGLSSFEIAPKEIPATAVVKEEEEKARAEAEKQREKAAAKAATGKTESKDKSGSSAMAEKQALPIQGKNSLIIACVAVGILGFAGILALKKKGVKKPSRKEADPDEDYEEEELQIQGPEELPDLPEEEPDGEEN